MRTYILIPLAFCLNYRLIAQELKVSVKVTSIDSLKYYVIIKATSETGINYNILSSKDERPAYFTNYKYKDSSRFRKGKTYRFILQQTVRIKTDDGEYLFLNLRRTSFGNKLVLDNGELPYFGLNLYKDYLFE